MLVFLPLLLMIVLVGTVGTVVSYAERKSKDVPELTSNDEDTVAYLEACADSSYTAKLALTLIEEHNKQSAVPKQLAAHVESPKKPDWFHQTGTNPPLEEQWNMFVKDMGRCVDDDERLETVTAWASNNAKEYFSYGEKQDVLDFFSTKHGRARCRRVLWPKAKLPKIKKERSKGPGSAAIGYGGHVNVDWKGGAGGAAVGGNGGCIVIGGTGSALGTGPVDIKPR